MTIEIKNAVFDHVAERARELSDWHQVIWHYAEPAWREYRSAAWYVERLCAEGFAVETSSGGMPTAFVATFEHGDGPVIGAYAEYDAVPGNCQKAATEEGPRDGLSRFAAGHTDPHSGLGIGSLGGLLAAKQAMEKHNIPGTLKYFGEPAEKVRGSKPIHAAKGYYDGLDAMISFHPFYMIPLCNTVRWDTHCGACYSRIYSFECMEPGDWLSAGTESVIPAAHIAARAPGANDALFAMHGLTRALQGSMLPFAQGWSLSEAILTAGQATADNLPHRLAQIQYLWRTPDLDQAETILKVIDANAEAAAAATHCRVRGDWVSKSRPGLANHALAEIGFRNLTLAGPPTFGEDAKAAAREIQRNLGLEPMIEPFLPEIEQLIDPRQAEEKLRHNLPPSQAHLTSDDYTDMCWQTPTLRLYVGRPVLRAPDRYRYPDWVSNALGGIRETIDPMIVAAARAVGAIIVDLLTDGEGRDRIREEFERRTGGGIGGSAWIPPLADYDPPIHFRWPEYVSTPRGEEWWIPTAPDEA